MVARQKVSHHSGERDPLRVFGRLEGEDTMSSETLIVVIILALLLFGGGGGYYWNRRRR
jgi:hypothetical protein